MSINNLIKNAKQNISESFKTPKQRDNDEAREAVKFLEPNHIRRYPESNKVTYHSMDASLDSELNQYDFAEIKHESEDSTITRIKYMIVNPETKEFYNPITNQHTDSKLYAYCGNTELEAYGYKPGNMLERMTSDMDGYVVVGLYSDVMDSRWATDLGTPRGPLASAYQDHTNTNPENPDSLIHFVNSAYQYHADRQATLVDAADIFDDVLPYNTEEKSKLEPVPDAVTSRTDTDIDGLVVVHSGDSNEFRKPRDMGLGKDFNGPSEYLKYYHDQVPDLSKNALVWRQPDYRTAKLEWHGSNDATREARYLLDDDTPRLIRYVPYDIYDNTFVTNIGESSLNEAFGFADDNDQFYERDVAQQYGPNVVAIGVYKNESGVHITNDAYQMINDEVKPVDISDKFESLVTYTSESRQAIEEIRLDFTNLDNHNQQLK